MPKLIGLPKCFRLRVGKERVTRWKKEIKNVGKQNFR